jgi:ATP synthase protein I
MKFRNKTPLHRLPAFRVLRVQALVCLVVLLVTGVIWGLIPGYSSFLGGLIALLSNGYLAFKAFRFFGARSAHAIVQSFWSGEMGKQILAAALFALVFVAVSPLNPVALFAGYFLVVMTGASGLLLLGQNPKH